MFRLRAIQERRTDKTCNAACRTAAELTEHVDQFIGWTLTSVGRNAAL